MGRSYRLLTQVFPRAHGVNRHTGKRITDGRATRAKRFFYVGLVVG